MRITIRREGYNMWKSLRVSMCKSRGREEGKKPKSGEKRVGVRRREGPAVKSSWLFTNR